MARRHADAGPLTLVPCDILPDNGAVLGRLVRELAEAVDPALVDWLDHQVTTAATMVDRITPEPTEADRSAVLEATGVDDRSPVVTEPFSEWVLAGRFPGGRPAWETAGALLVDDVTPFEERKLWLLNGGHSLLAYAGALRGHGTVAQAVADPYCYDLLRSWWSTGAPHVGLPREEIADYCSALLSRFVNPRMRHSLAQIAVDGSQKIPVRFLPVLRRERAAGRLPEPAVTVLAAWLLLLRGAALPVVDVRAAELRSLCRTPLTGSVPRLLSALDPGLGDDDELIGAVATCAGELSGRR